MKKRILFLSLLVSFNVAAFESKYKCDEIIFKGLTKDHLKEISVCKTNSKFVSYTFGEVSKIQPEVDVIVPASNATWDNIYKDDISIYAFNMEHEKNKYSMILGYEKDGPGAIAGIYVTPVTSPKDIEEIALDPESVEENITHQLLDYGIDQYTKEN